MAGMNKGSTIFTIIILSCFAVQLTAQKKQDSISIGTKQQNKEDNRLDKKPHRSPLQAVCFSAVVPGGGQLYTQQYLRAVAFAGGLGYLGYCYHREDTSAIGNPDQDDYNYHNKRRRKYKWWFAGIWILSLADAYVDAHMFKFDERSEPGISLDISPTTIYLTKRF
jgi:hypothetical protein